MDIAEARAEAEASRYAQGFIETSILKLMVEIGVADALEQRGGPMTLSELSSATGAPVAALYRIMRFLSHRGIFKQQISPNSSSAVTYAPTLVSRYLTMDKLGMCLLMQPNPISVADLMAGKGSGLEPASTADKLWKPETDEEYHGNFHKMLDSHSRSTAASLVKNAAEIFQGIGSLVDIGGRAGTTLGVLVKAFPWIKGINLDLPHVIAAAAPVDGVVHVGGDMFKAVPKADAVMLMCVLHDWGDVACINILKKCREAIHANAGKVIIVEVILDEDDDGKERDELSGARLLWDMTIMMVTAHGKERTAKEWAKLIEAAGFRRHAVKHMQAIESVIEAYP